MEIKRHSQFKDRDRDLDWFDNWVEDLETLNGRKYKANEIETALGKTHVWGLNEHNDNLETLVIFPGARTTSLFWDFDKGLDNIGTPLNVYLIETNGLPNLSDGKTPDIKSDGYGKWAAEVMDKLHIERAFVAGASFGGLICMKLSITNPEKIKAVFLLNPGCLQSFSMTLKNLYCNLLPIIAPSANNVRKFLDNAVFCKPNHMLSEASEKLIVDYEVFAITRYRDNTQKPYDMDSALLKVKNDVHLIVGDKDLLFPYERSVANAKAKIQNLKSVKVYGNVGHGIETYGRAMRYIGKMIKLAE